MTTNLFRGQAVKVTSAHNQFSPCDKTEYRIAQVSKINGVISVMLTLDGQVSGAIPEFKVTPINS